MKNRLFHNNRFLSSNFKSDTTVPNTETPSSFNDIQDSEPPVLFPWKTMTELPEPTSIFSYITSILKKELNHVLLTSMRLRFIDSWDYHALRIYWSHEFTEGSELAFKAATKAIFSSLSNLIIPSTTDLKYDDDIPFKIKEKVEAVTPVVDDGTTSATSETTEAITAAITAEEVVVDEYEKTDMNLIFEPGLTTFFKDALSRFENLGHKVTHKITNVEFSRISRCELLLWCSRSLNMQGLIAVGFPNSILGPCRIMRVKEKKNGVNWDKLRDVMTIRIGVEMSVAELFHVNDKISGALLQGEENTVKLNKHELLLETTYNISTMELGDWCIVDIDNWMSGNHFWFDQSDLIKKNEED